MPSMFIAPTLPARPITIRVKDDNLDQVLFVTRVHAHERLIPSY
jgi:hypothetical protein